jgi:sec-independent protein translocase protein TatC
MKDPYGDPTEVSLKSDTAEEDSVSPAGEEGTEEITQYEEEAVSPPDSPPPPTDGGGGDDDGGGDGEDGLGAKMTFLEHLEELRKRIIWSFVAIAVTFVIGWIFREEIFRFLAEPIYAVLAERDANLVVTKPTEPFTIYLKVAFVAAVFLAAPAILFQVWLFIAPGLYRREKAYAIPFLVSSTVLFLLGGVFAYYILLPTALHFLINEFGREFQPMISAVEYFSFELIVLIGMGIIFQLPILIAFLSMFGLVTPRFLWKNFRYAFLLMVIIAAVVSPTVDAINLFLWTGPMVILYLLSIGVSWIFKRRRARRDGERY